MNDQSMRLLLSLLLLPIALSLDWEECSQNNETHRIEEFFALVNLNGDPSGEDVQRLESSFVSSYSEISFSPSCEYALEATLLKSIADIGNRILSAPEDTKTRAAADPLVWETSVLGQLDHGNGVFLTPDQTSLIVVSSSGTVFSLSSRTGELLWEFNPLLSDNDGMEEVVLRCQSGVSFATDESEVPYMAYSIVDISGEYPTT